MNSDFWSFILTFFSAIGGVGLIVFGLSAWLGKVWSDRLAEKLKSENATALERVKTDFLRDIESHKVRLKKSEFLFQKEFEAASAFAALFRTIHPGFLHPLMDWYDACDEIASNFGAIEEKLNQYFSEFSAVLTDEERQLLSEAISDAGYSKFEVDSEDIPTEANQAADALYNKLKELNSKLIARVRNQASA